MWKEVLLLPDKNAFTKSLAAKKEKKVCGHYSRWVLVFFLFCFHFLLQFSPLHLFLVYSRTVWFDLLSECKDIGLKTYSSLPPPPMNINKKIVKVFLQLCFDILWLTVLSLLGRVAALSCRLLTEMRGVWGHPDHPPFCKCLTLAPSAATSRKSLVAGGWDTWLLNLASQPWPCLLPGTSVSWA